MAHNPTFNSNAANFNQVGGGYNRAVLYPDVGSSNIPGTTRTPLQGPASELRMHFKDGDNDVYKPSQIADFDEQESITVTGK